VKMIKGPAKKGLHRVSWDLTESSKMPISLQPPRPAGEFNPFQSVGVRVLPGIYRAFVAKVEDGKFTPLTDTVSFKVEKLKQTRAIQGSDLQVAAKFWHQVASLQAEVFALSTELKPLKRMAQAMQEAVRRAPKATPQLIDQVNSFYSDIVDLERQLTGSPTRAEVGEIGQPTVMQRLSPVLMGVRGSTYGPNQNSQRALQLAQKQFDEIKTQFKQLRDQRRPQLLEELRKAGAPYIECQDW
jgi:hypothetical protein